MNKQKILKLVIFSDLHYLDEQHEEQYNRKLTKLAIPLLEKLEEKINNNIKPDICIYLGDFIEDTNNHDQDIKNLKYIYNKFKKIKVPFYAVPGNHDLRSMNFREEVENIMGYDHSTFSINVKGYHLVFLGLDVRKDLGTENGGIFKTQFISDDDLEWLKKDLKENDLPCIILNHFGIAEDDMNGNWWFESYPEYALLGNRKELKEILKSKNNIIGVFSGHQHWTKKLKEDNIDYYVVGSLTENINNNGIPDGVYFEVNIEDDKVNIVEKHIKLYYK